jgi:hypothetical protein
MWGMAEIMGGVSGLESADPLVRTGPHAREGEGDKTRKNHKAIARGRHYHSGDFGLVALLLGHLLAHLLQHQRVGGLGAHGRALDGHDTVRRGATPNVYTVVTASEYGSGTSHAHMR